MNISELVAGAILEMIESSNGTAEIQRNELASSLGCVPSQINYVITSRFTPEHGYTVESRRGGGGYIRITRVQLDRPSAIMHLLNCIGDELDAASAKAIIGNLVQNELIGAQTGMVMLAACSENAYRLVSISERNKLRASIMKQMLINLN